VLNAKDTALDLSGWVTVNNQSGATYKDAKLKLIAGDVRRIQPPQSITMAGMARRAMLADESSSASKRNHSSNITFTRWADPQPWPTIRPSRSNCSRLPTFP